MLPNLNACLLVSWEFLLMVNCLVMRWETDRTGSSLDILVCMYLHMWLLLAAFRKYVSAKYNDVQAGPVWDTQRD